MTSLNKLKIYKILIDVEQKSQMKYKIQERKNVVYKQMTIITIRLLLERMSTPESTYW